MTQAPYYQTPKSIMQLPISSDAKILLVEFLDKIKLSMLPANKKAFQDKEGKPFIRMAQETMAKFLGRSAKTVRKALRQLIDAGLVIQKRIGLGCCNIYYLAESLINSIFPTEREPSTQPKRQASPSNNNNLKNNNSMGYACSKNEPKYPKKTVLAQQYTQTEYTREELNSLIKDI